MARLLDAEAGLHRFFAPDKHDEKLLGILHGLLERFRTETIDGIKGCREIRGKDLQVEAIKRVGHRASELRKELQKHLLRAETRVIEMGIVSPEKTLDANKQSTRERSVVSVDMLAYSSHAISQEDLLGPEGVHTYNQRLQAIFEEAMRHAKADPKNTLHFNTGDGVLVYFLDPITAIRFAVHVHKIASEKNLGVHDESRKRHFRVGIATNNICVELKTDRLGTVVSFTAAGVATIDAVRLQARCAPGAIWICEKTHKALPQYQELFDGPHVVVGKEHENREIAAFSVRSLYDLHMRMAGE